MDMKDTLKICFTDEKQSTKTVQHQKSNQNLMQKKQIQRYQIIFLFCVRKIAEEFDKKRVKDGVGGHIFSIRIKSTQHIVSSQFKENQFLLICLKTIFYPHNLSRETTSFDQLQSSLEDTEKEMLQIAHLAAEVVLKACLFKGNSKSLLVKYQSVTDLFDKLLQLQIVEIDEPILGILNQCCTFVRVILV